MDDEAPLVGLLTSYLEREGFAVATAADGARAVELAREGSELRAGTADAFPDYYTLHVLEGDRLAGMLSVNAYTGAVWYHRWHGRFLSMTE